MAPETKEDLELLRDAAREVEARFAPKGAKFPFWQKPTTSKVRFGARASGLHDDGLSTKPAPGPKGPPTETLIEEAKRRRRERAEEERNRR